ncbi:Crp/Fnr family transcriptional regulator [Jiulongibacter sp. NS-SX5]|uniref:Crp/Fnr family transcriptional regulator n=1 Tax=Jiulongibacter sp. NS-SX5 TaxID=3463854 RepID=UPI004058F40D
MQTLLNQLLPYTSLSKDESDYLQKCIQKKVYKKHEIIFSAGQVSKEIYFVTKGCVRLFYLVDGQDKTAFFYTEGQFICAGESYTFGTPAVENYEALENTELYSFSKEQIDRLLHFSPKFELIARIATENELICSQKIIASFVTKSAEQRYLDLLETQGELLQRVPQQYIATYLGVSPETLSRIKQRVFQKNRS